MNVITILVDSLNRHYLEPYGCDWVKTPNLQKFAERAVVFDQHFIGSAPCMPARRELFTGRHEFLWRPWGPLEPFDDPIAREARKAGAVTQMITDHYHYWENRAHGYFEEFQGVEFLRGQECDMYRTDPPGEIPEWAEAINKWRPRLGTRYYRNVMDYRCEEDFGGPRVMQSAADWIDRNHAHKKFFLWTESFDVHEPFYVPEPYRSMYTSDLNPAYNCWPPYQDEEILEKFMAQVGQGEIEFLRAQYAGKVTMVDTWLGRIFEALDRHNLWDETMVIITTDHGHDLATNRRFGKEWPHYESHANIPLMIWHPEQAGRGRRVDALTAAVDLYPTILEALGHASIRSHDGRSLMPVIRGEAAEHRDWVLYGTFSRAPRFGGAAISTRDWTLAQGSRARVPYYAYGCTLGSLGDDLRQAEAGRFMPDVDIPMWRVPREAVECPSFLWDRSERTLEPRNLLDEKPGKAAEMRQLLRTVIERVGCPPEQYERLEL